jgi:cytochrome c-type biogenesis protein CcmE
MALFACRANDSPSREQGSAAIEPATSEVKLVDELVSADYDRALRVCGTVEKPFAVTGSGAERVIAFGLTHGGKHMRTIATGVLPIDFREHANVCVVGRWLDAAFARPIVSARHLNEGGDVFDADSVWVRAPF